MWRGDWSELELLGAPAALGHLHGRYRKYADAFAPLPPSGEGPIQGAAALSAAE